MAPGTPAEVAALMPKLIVDLPGHDPFLSLEMFRLSPEDLLLIFIYIRIVKTMHMSPAKNPPLSVFRF